MTHMKDESLSAFIDDEVDEAERALIQNHIQECTECSARLERLRSAGTVFASIPEEAPTADETRALRQAILARRPKWWTRVAPAARAAVAGAAILLIGFVTFATLNRGPTEDKATTAAPERAASTEILAISADNQELVDYIRGDQEIQSQVGKYRVSDAEDKQQEVLADYGAAAAPAAAAPADSAERQAASTSRATSEATSGAPQQGSPPPARSLGFCLRAWVRLRPNSIPITGRAADFQGQPAWLLVYAYSPSEDANAALDHLTILVVRRAGCERDDAILRALPLRPSPSP